MEVFPCLRDTRRLDFALQALFYFDSKVHQTEGDERTRYQRCCAFLQLLFIYCCGVFMYSSFGTSGMRECVVRSMLRIFICDGVCTGNAMGFRLGNWQKIFGIWLGESWVWVVNFFSCVIWVWCQASGVVVCLEGAAEEDDEMGKSFYIYMCIRVPDNNDKDVNTYQGGVHLELWPEYPEWQIVHATNASESHHYNTHWKQVMLRRFYFYFSVPMTTGHLEMPFPHPAASAQKKPSGHSTYSS